LIIPDLDKEIRVEVDMLDFAIDGVLLMKWKPVAYISKSLNKAKKNSKIYNKEMLAIIRCLEV